MNGKGYKTLPSLGPRSFKIYKEMHNKTLEHFIDETKKEKCMANGMNLEDYLIIDKTKI